MNIRDLEYLVSVASLGNFGKAADACFVSQPALSIQIKKLEAHLGVQLFERTNKSVRLTSIGDDIVAQARQILHEVDNLCELAKNASNPLVGSIRIGIFPTISAYLLHRIMPMLTQSLPQVSFYLVEEKTQYLLAQIRTGELDAAILSLPIDEKGLIVHDLFDEEFLLAVPHKHPLAQKMSIKKDILDQEALLLLDEGHCMRDQVIDFCNKIDQNNRLTVRATSLETLRYMVMSGIGLTLMPRLSTEQCNLVTYIPFCEPKPVRTIVLVYRTVSSKKILLQAIERDIKEIMNPQ